DRLRIRDIETDAGVTVTLKRAGQVLRCTRIEIDDHDRAASGTEPTAHGGTDRPRPPGHHCNVPTVHGHRLTQTIVGRVRSLGLRAPGRRGSRDARSRSSASLETARAVGRAEPFKVYTRWTRTR